LQIAVLVRISHSYKKILFNLSYSVSENSLYFPGSALFHSGILGLKMRGAEAPRQTKTTLMRKFPL
jgi:hypothetical protein